MNFWVESPRVIGLNVWTVNTEDRMRQLMAWDVNSVISNYPDMCLRLLGR